MMPLAFEIEHGVDDMLERFRAGEVPVLRYVPDEERRDVLPLGFEEQLRRRLAHLPDAAGRRLEFQGEDCLNRIDDHQCRFDPRDLVENPFETRLREEIERRITDGEALAARLDLV